MYLSVQSSFLCMREYNKKQITSCTRISANIRVRLFAVREHGLREKQKLAHFSHRPSLLSKTFSRSSSPLPYAHARGSHTDVEKRTNVVLLLATSLYDTTFKLVVAHPPIVRSPVGYIIPPLVPPSTHIYDVVIFRWRIRHRYVISPRIHYRVAEQYAHECITAHPQSAGLDGYIRDCDLRYRKLLSKARPKMRGGCIKFLNSGMTATRRRCLPVVAADVRLHEAKPSERLTRQTSYFRKMRQSEFCTRQMQRRTNNFRAISHRQIEIFVSSF